MSGLKEDNNWFKLCEVAEARYMWANNPKEYCKLVIEAFGERESSVKGEISHLLILLEEHDPSKLVKNHFKPSSRRASEVLGDEYPPRVIAIKSCLDGSGWFGQGYIFKSSRVKLWKKVKGYDKKLKDIKKWEYFKHSCCNKYHHFSGIYNNCD